MKWWTKKNTLYSSAIVPHLKNHICAFFFFFFPSKTFSHFRSWQVCFSFIKTMAQIKWFFFQPIQAFVFSSGILLFDCPFKTDFSQNKCLETNGQTALAYLFTIAHTFWNALQSDRLESFWISETTAPFGGLGWQCVSRICSTSFGLSLGQSFSVSI